MKRLFIHTASRVIRRATIDDEVQPGADETAVQVGYDWDLRHMGKYWKLDNTNQPVEATEADIDASDVDPVRVHARRTAVVAQITTIMQDIADNGATLPKLTQLIKKQLLLRR